MQTPFLKPALPPTHSFLLSTESRVVANQIAATIEGLRRNAGVIPPDQPHGGLVISVEDNPVE